MHGLGWCSAGMNNRAWFYSVDTRQLVNQKEYHGTVSQAVLGADYAAVRVEGQALARLVRWIATMS